MNVLVVMDMQEGLFSVPRYRKDVVIANINRLISAIRGSSGRVIHVQHDGLEEDELAKGMDGWKILEEIDLQPDDLVIEKETCDAFYNTDLEARIRALAPERLIVTGCCTDFCVDSTVRAAVSRDFPVIVPADAHTTADRPHLDSGAIVTHHNYCWENMTTPGIMVRVLPTADLVKELAV